MIDTPAKLGELWYALSSLTQAQFEELVFAADPPAEIISGTSANFNERLGALLDWAASPSGPGLSVLELIHHQLTASDQGQKEHQKQRQETSSTLQHRLIITHHRKTAQYFTEDLGKGVNLDMVLIPGGTFLMGSPDDELERYDKEGPQHEVSVPTFFMGKFPVTQAQWRVVAEMYPQVQQKLDLNPAKFKGDNRPVEQVSWLDAVEFCARLSQRTKREYRLPSEAEWEYACRAGTTTPFHFGKTITTDLANYDGYRKRYGQGPEGTSRGETTEVGYLANANQFGLYDMHGNVWEYCQDHWHDNYEGNPPTDGRAWLFSNEDKSSDPIHVMRGGCYGLSQELCRSACRVRGPLEGRHAFHGFRVACSTA